MTKHEIIRFRCTLAERLELEDRAKGDISKYIRRMLFEEQAQALSNIERKLDGLYEEVSVPSHSAPPKAEEVRDQGQPVEFDTATQGMLLELLLRARGMDMRSAQAQVERQGLPVWEDPTPLSSFATSNSTVRKAQPEVKRHDPPGKEGRGLGSLFKKRS
jgi:hypothetical protein